MNNDKDIFNNKVNLKKVLTWIFEYRGIYLTCVLVSLVIAFLYNHFTERKFSNFATIYISAENTGSSQENVTGSNALAGLFKSENNIKNEAGILRSYTLTRKVIDDLDLKVSYFSCNAGAASNLFFNTPFVRKTELYNDSPIKVVLDPSVPQPVDLNFTITLINENEFQIESGGKNTELYNYIDDHLVSRVPEVFINRTTYHFGDEIRSQYFNFRIQKSDRFNKDFTKEKNLFFRFNNVNLSAVDFVNHLSIKPVSHASTLLRVKYTGTNREKVTDFLNGLTSVYLERNLDKKNQMALNTVDFIDSQISNVADTLNKAESRLKTFRSSNGLVGMSYQGQEAYDMLRKLENEKSNLNSQHKYYAYLKDYLNNPGNTTDILAPSSINVVDPMLASMVTRLIELNTQKINLISNPGEVQGTLLTNINLQIESLRKTLLENVNNAINNLNTNLNEINYRINKLSGQISQMPRAELQLKGMERKFEYTDELYSYLLKKRSEAQIAQVSSMPDYEVIDPARLAVAYSASPKAALNFLYALLIAFFLPTLVIFGRNYLKHSISEPEEIEIGSPYPILGKVFHNFRRTKMVVNDFPNSSVTECFRGVRTNFQFFSEGTRRQIILVTSTSSGEGKTFCSLNMATAFALNGLKTVLLEFDLRKPSIHQEFEASNMIGISSFLIGKAGIEDIILPTHIENMDLISAGPAAPNPAELISSERTVELFDKLREMYDYVIIDSAPVGILTETMLLMKLADLNVFVARMDKTIREAFSSTLRNFANNNIINIALLINDIDVTRQTHKYPYNHKYYADDEREGLLSKLFRRKSKSS